MYFIISILKLYFFDIKLILQNVSLRNHFIQNQSYIKMIAGLINIL